MLATLSDGTRVLSTVLTDQTPVRHVYRVIGRDGSPVHEFATLIELHAFIAARRAL